MMPVIKNERPTSSSAHQECATAPYAPFRTARLGGQLPILTHHASYARSLGERVGVDSASGGRARADTVRSQLLSGWAAHRIRNGRTDTSFVRQDDSSDRHRDHEGLSQGQQEPQVDVRAIGPAEAMYRAKGGPCANAAVGSRRCGGRHLMFGQACDNGGYHQFHDHVLTRAPGTGPLNKNGQAPVVVDKTSGGDADNLAACEAALEE